MKNQAYIEGQRLDVPDKDFIIASHEKAFWDCYFLKKPKNNAFVTYYKFAMMLKEKDYGLINE